ncbi:NADPH-dependent oxidoreductase [Leptolyngbya sp. FACHB-261]|uniref:NADPH-dependent oxidoreductase n=1 Tax=Leptolyngbya sp. FACHB-261 TaxID=2692806 RepID=UPI0016872CBF|nr:NADPH-dependent oxidoreductase [Leptolyngbya sp. FACHB-261]MBD2102794.1 NADPH-dependent oxidoreductase [Leptolyngbya sp. FACHB-261]
MTHKPELLQARYGIPNFQIDGELNSCLETLLSHRSIRAYLPQPLPKGTLETLIAAAQSAATSSNLQTWSVVAVEDAGRKERLSQFAGGQAHIRQCPLFLVWLADLARIRHVAQSRGLTHDGLNYLEMFVTAVVDAALAAQNAVVAAESLGLGTVYIGGMRNQPEAVATELGLPLGVFATFGLCIGYPNPERPAAVKPRLPQAAVLHRERYAPLEAQDQALNQYNQVMTDFYQQQQMEVPGNWAQHSAKRVAGPDSLSGRDRLHQVLKNLGFELR